MEKDLKKKLFLILLPLLLLTAAVVSMLIYQNSTLSRIREQTRESMQTAVRQQSTKLQSDLAAQMTLLKTFAVTLSSGNADIKSELQRSLSDVAKSSRFGRVYYVGGDGSALSNDGYSFSVADRQYFRDSMRGESCVRKVSSDRIFGKPGFVISVPVYQRNVVVGVLCGIYDEITFRSMMFPAGSGDCFIASGDGNIIIGSAASGPLLGGVNAFSELRDATYEDGYSWEQLHDEITRRSPGLVRLTLGGSSYYAVHQTFKLNDWSIFNVISAEVADGPANNLVRSGYIQLGFLCFVFLMSLGIEISAMQRQIRHVEIEEDYKNQISLYRTSRLGGVLRYRIDDYLTLLYANDKCYQIIGYRPHEMRTKLYRHCINFIYPDDREMVREKFRKALSTHTERLEWVMRIVTSDGKVKYILSDGKFEIQNNETVLVGIVVDITEQKKAELALQEEKDALLVSEERFRIALENTSVCIWEYDIATHSVQIEQHEDSTHGLPRHLEHVPQCLLSSGYVMPESESDCIELYRKLDAGEKNAEAILRVHTPDRSEPWYEYIRYTALLSGDGKPYRAIGVSEDVTERVVAARKFEKEISLRRSSQQEVYASAVLNLDDEAIESVESVDAKLKWRTVGLTIDGLFERMADGIIEDQRARRSIRSLSAASLRRTYNEGQEAIDFEFQWKPDENPPRWFSFEIRMTSNPSSKVLYAFLYLHNIDESKREKELLEKQAHSDPLTGIYNVTTARRLIDDYLTGEGLHSFCAFLMLDLDCFKQVNDQLSHYEGDRVLIRVASELQKEFRASDITARIGGDEFIVFLKDIPSVKFIRTKAAILCEALQFTQSNGKNSVHISCSVGIALCNGGNKTYSDLYQEADRALSHTKNSGKSHYTLLQDLGELGGDIQERDAAESISLTARNNTVQL